MSPLWPGLPAFLANMALGMCMALPLCKPAWHSYGGTIAPGMPIYDEAAYPCAVVVCSDPELYDGGSCTMYLFSGIPAVEEDSFKAWETDLNVMVFRVRGNVWTKESAFTLALDTGTKAQYSNFVWANFDLYTLDSQLLVSASEPLPAADYVTTLFEGDVTTVAEDYIITNPSTGAEYTYALNGAHAVIADSALLDSYGLVRITVDAVPVGYKIRSLALGDYAGNYHLADAEKEDTGGSFGVLSFLLSGETLILSREPGTFHVKVEKIERRAQKQPVAYLYNGVRLPTVEGFPYMFIENSPGLGEYLYCCASELVTITAGNDLRGYYDAIDFETGTGKFVLYFENGRNDNDEVIAWGTTGDVQERSVKSALSNVKWANFNVFATDGTLYLAASEPVPVYE